MLAGLLLLALTLAAALGLYARSASRSPALLPPPGLVAAAGLALAAALNT